MHRLQGAIATKVRSISLQTIVQPNNGPKYATQRLLQTNAFRYAETQNYMKQPAALKKHDLWVGRPILP